MPSTIKLTDGDPILTDEEPAALVERCDAARADGTLVTVKDNNDRAHSFNPAAVVAISERQPFDPEDYRIKPL